MRSAVVLAGMLLAVSGAVYADHDGFAGAVYTMTNAPGQNQVLVFHRNADGSLVAAGAFSTGGAGTGAGLGNQGGLALSRNNRWLFAVNAGSNEVSVFRVTRDGLDLVDTVSSGGSMPISVTVHGRLVFVVNAASANIAGFRLSRWGKLEPIPGTTLPLSSANPAPAQIQFSPDGEVLVVTEKNTNKIVWYRVEDDGLVAGPMIRDSEGMTPFGFAFGHRDQMFVSEAFGGAPDASAVSSYVVEQDNIAAIDGSVPTNQTAACWVVVTSDGRFLYTTNTGSGTVSRYRIAHNGEIELLGNTPSGAVPIDATLTNDSRILYVLNSGAATISAFRTHADGGLTALPGVSGLPATANGLVAR
jgi:6-phosphogluconolactonase (cycloisomerase 2 family)